MPSGEKQIGQMQQRVMLFGQKAKDFIPELEAKFGNISYAVNPEQFSALMRRSANLDQEPDASNRDRAEQNKKELAPVFGALLGDDGTRMVVDGSALNADSIPLLRVNKETGSFVLIQFYPKGWGDEAKVGDITVHLFTASSYIPEESDMASERGLFYKATPLTRGSPLFDRGMMASKIEALIAQIHQQNERLLKQDPLLARKNV